MVTPELKKYIQDQTQAGVSESVLRAQLEQQGWASGDLDEAFGLRPSAIPQPSVGGVIVKYGGFWIRFVAILVDGSIISFATSILFIPFVLIAPEYAYLVTYIGIALGLFYYVVMQSSKYQATVGKMLTGLRVESEEGSRISFLRSLGREVGKYISSIILMIGFIMAGFTKKKQSLHDMMASTVVIKHKPARTGPILLIIFGPIILQVIAVVIFGSILLSMMLGFGAGQVLSENIIYTDTEDSYLDEGALSYLTSEEYESELASYNGVDEFDLEEPGVYVGPALIELDSFFDNGEQDEITVYLPPITNIKHGEVILALDGIYSHSGVNELDVNSSFETDEFFTQVTLVESSDEFGNLPYYYGYRSVHYIEGDMMAEDIGRVEGRLIIRLPLNTDGGMYEKVYPFVIEN